MGNIFLGARRDDYILLISLASFFIPLILFTFRHLDDNRLTSWQWTFAGAEVSTFFFVLIIGIIVAYTLSRFSFFEDFPALFLIILAFTIGMIFWREPEVIIDASRYFTQAKHLKEYGIKFFIVEWGREINAWTDLPLIPFIYGIIFKLFGENRIYIQITTTLFFTMTVLHTYLIGKTLWDRDTGFYAGMSLLSMPYLFTQVPLMLVDVGTMFFLTLSIFTLIKALDKGGIWLPVSSTAIFLAVFSKYSTWMMLSVLGVILLVYMLINRPRVIIYRGIIIGTIAGLLIGTVILYKFSVIKDQIELLFTYQRPALKRWSESFISTFFYQIHPFITIIALGSLYVALKKRDIKYMIICWLMILIILLWIKRIRYIIPIFPMFALMASYGLDLVKDNQLRRFLIFSAVATSLIIGVFVYLPFLQKMAMVNFQNAGRYLNSLETAQIRIITLPHEGLSINPAVSVPILDLYTEKHIYYPYIKISPPEGIKRSPLRFTWEYRNPAYYEVKKEEIKDMPIIIISPMPAKVLPKYIEKIVTGYKKNIVFDSSTGVFRYSPVIMTYLPQARSFN